MAELAHASVLIVPKFNGLTSSINSALNGVDVTQAGTKMGNGLASGIEKGTGGLAKSGAIMGIFSAATTKAMDLISSSVSGAVSRLDTLNNYPRVMQALGYSAEESEASIAKMSEHLTGLPTALNDMTSTVQGISAVTGDLTLATDAGLALNDMLLASGSSTQLTSAAMEQFRQMLAKGKPEMQDWRSLTSAMPGQMNQLAQAMLGPTANANDLYAALGGGGGEATISMEQLMQKMIELDTQGGDSITSFADQAKNATGGIESSMSNMQTAVVRGMADIMDSIGTDTISGAVKGIGEGFESALKLVGDGIEFVKPYVSGFVDVLKEVGPSAAPAIAGLVGLAAAGKGLSGLASIVGGLSGRVGAFKGIATGVSESLLALSTNMKSGSKASEGLFKASGLLAGSMGGPLVAGIGLAVATVGACVSSYMDMKKKSDNLRDATTGLTDAVKSQGGPIQTVSGAYDSLSGSAEVAAVNVGDVCEAVYNQVEASAKLADSIKARSDETMASVGLLETYKQTISEYANQSDLDAQKQAELAFAIEQVNGQCGTQYELVDAANGKIADQNGVIQENTDQILANIDAKQRSLRVEAAGETYKDTYRNQQEALGVLQEAEKARYDYLQAHGGDVENLGFLEASEYGKLSQAVMTAKTEYEGSVEASKAATKGLLDASTGADQLATALMNMSMASPELQSALSAMGTTSDELSQKLQEAGVSSDTLAEIAPEDFAQMAEACGGDIQKLVGMIDMYNAVPIIDHEGNIRVEDAELMDAQGNIYVWNGSEFVNKTTGAAVDDRELLDAQGNLWVWNGSELIGKGSTAQVDGNASDGSAQASVDNTNLSISNIHDKSADVNINGNYDSAGRSIWDVVGAIGSLASKTVDVVTNYFTNGESHNAAGGIRLNAAGGYRYHAHGAIATKAMPLDIVGEDGAEAIVPLTNKKYSEPFARTIAEQMGNVGTTQYNVYIDGIQANDNEAMIEHVWGVLGEAMALSGISRR